MLPFTDGKPLKFAIDKVEKPFLVIGNIVFSKFPVPDKKNTYKKNSHILIDWRDKFFQRRKKDSRYNALFGLINYAITKLERDDYYGDIVKDLLYHIQNTDFEYNVSNNFKDFMEE